MEDILLKTASRCDIILTVKDGYLICPRCRVNRKVCKVDPDTTAHNLAVFCRNCKLELKVDIVEGQCYQSRSQ